MNERKELKIGLTVLAALILFYLVVAWTSRIHLFAPKEYRYQISFANVNGLLEGDPVNVRGYTSGRVEAILPQSEVVQVSISLDQRIQLFQDAVAEIQIKELMGGKMIDIHPGSRPPTLAAGSKFSGKIATDFSSAFSQFGEFSEEIQPADLQRLLARLDAFTQYLGQVTQEVPPEQIGQLFADLGSIGARSNRILSSLEAQDLPTKIDQGFTEFTKLSQQGKGLMQRADTLLSKAESDLLPQAEELFVQTEQTLSEVQILLGEAQILLDQAQDTSALVGRMLQDPNLSIALDSTLYHLTKTLKQIHEKRVIVGIRRKKE